MVDLKDDFIGDSAALIIGLTVQGLSVARALSLRGVIVYAVDRKNISRPAAKSRFLKMFERQGVSPDLLPDTLLELREKIPQKKVVLFPCSDKTVRSVADNWEKLSNAYLLSWSGCTELTASFTFKSVVCDHAAKNGVDYPEARLIESMEDCAGAKTMHFPLIVKPNSPPGSFKTLKLQDVSQLEDVVRNHGDSLPLLAQECIEGGDDRLQFCTFFMDNGRSVADITGKKRRSFPEALGRGTILELYEDKEVRQKALAFLEGLPLCGPIAVEFKRDALGKLWLIEPTVGRTEYCVDLSIQGGLDLPFMEYCYALGLNSDKVFNPQLNHNVIWYDTEIEPLCYLRECLRQHTLRPWGKRPYFPYFGHNDPLPVIAALFQLVLNTYQKGYYWAVRRLKRLSNF